MRRRLGGVIELRGLKLVEQLTTAQAQSDALAGRERSAHSREGGARSCSGGGLGKFIVAHHRTIALACLGSVRRRPPDLPSPLMCRSQAGKTAR